MDKHRKSVDQMMSGFLDEEIMTMSISAAFMHGRVYIPGTSEDDRWAVRRGVKDELQRIGQTYSQAIGNEVHIENIIDLSNRLSVKFDYCLREGVFRIGIAQKVLNLYLKYLWCLGKIPEPPHCPFDSRIIDLLPPLVRAPFTKVEKIEVYESWVVEAKKKAGNTSLAEWELAEYERLRE